MGKKIGSLKKDISLEFQNMYGETAHERTDYSFIMLLVDKFPEFEISLGFPKYLLGDAWEIVYDIFGNYDVKSAITNKDSRFQDFIDFVEECAKKSEYKQCVQIVFDGIYGVLGVSDMYKLFGETTVNIWREYTKDWNNLKDSF